MSQSCRRTRIARLDTFDQMEGKNRIVVYVICVNFKEKNTERKAFNLTFRYFDDVLLINNPDVGNWIPLIYPQ